MKFVKTCLNCGIMGILLNSIGYSDHIGNESPAEKSRMIYSERLHDRVYVCQDGTRFGFPLVRLHPDIFFASNCFKGNIEYINETPYCSRIIQGTEILLKIHDKL